MPDDLRIYYERELSFLRQMGAEFATKYQKIAGRLLLEADRTEDPHVERLLQGVALLTARIQRKLDDELPEITDALLGVLYPHYLAPMPSMAIVQFVHDPTQGQLTSGYHIAPGATLYAQPVQGTSCRFRTCYPVTLWPLKITSARVDMPDRIGPMLRETAAVIRIEIQCVGGATFADLDLTKLRVFLDGESSLTYALYESLCNHTCQVQLRSLGGLPGQQPIVLPPTCVQPVGFAPDEGMLPYTPHSFLGYRLLQEYWCFPDKFLFVDLGELDQAARAGFSQGLEVVICLNRRPQFEQPITPRTFRLGCTPIINLFEQRAEPIRVTQVQTEYRVIPDIARPTTTEVYTVETVHSISPYVEEAIRFQPFYSFKHAADRGAQQVFWYTTRRPSPRQGDEGTEVYLSLVDLNFQPTLPAVETLTIHTTCTNRDLPDKLPFGGGSGELQMEGASPARIYCLTKLTETLRPTRRRGAQWRLISNLALNYLSLCEGGKEALQEILQLYNFADTAAIRQQIVGITNVSSRRVVGRPASMPWNGVCRGLEVTIEFDEDNFVGSGVFLFASVLEKFLGLYVSLNSFTQLVATTLQREEPVKRWPPRAGEQILL